MKFSIFFLFGFFLAVTPVALAVDVSPDVDYHYYASQDGVLGHRVYTFFDGGALYVDTSGVFAFGFAIFRGETYLQTSSGFSIYAQNLYSYLPTAEFHDNSVFHADYYAVVRRGILDFYDTSHLFVTAAGALLQDGGGVVNFYDESYLGALATDAIYSGVLNFTDNSALTATATRAITGGGTEFLRRFVPGCDDRLGRGGWHAKFLRRVRAHRQERVGGSGRYAEFFRQCQASR